MHSDSSLQWIVLKIMSPTYYIKVLPLREAQGRGTEPAELGDELYNMQDFPSSFSVERQIVDTVLGEVYYGSRSG